MSAPADKIAEALRASLKEAEGLRRQNRELRGASTEPIAIVGMACRYPGGVSSADDLWRLLSEAGDGISEFPADRGWDVGRIYDPDSERAGTSYTRSGGFVEGAADFDAGFFGISPREALYSDPQQRLLLEACWEALEEAGVDPSSLRGTPTGVFAGSMFQDYGEHAAMTSSVISGRVSYSLGLEGPAVTVDTACSSSLVAMHLAAQALRSGECSLALAGGVTVLSTPGVFVEFSRQRGLSPDGRCKSFADAADGLGFAEGVGVLALERLSDAQRQGHPILATIRGSAVNQDGASNGLTAPNGPSQERVIRQALANARLTPQDIDAVEAHGTGTTLGDPIEAGALLATYGQDRERPLKLGSVKSNIGHTQAAAGAAGVIKAVLAMREGILPKTLHVDQPSSKVDWEAGEIELLTEAEPWEANGRPRRAAVSSFGISGTNAHLILEEAPESEPEAGDGEQVTPPGDGGEGPPLRPIPLVLSAKSEDALRDQALRLRRHLAERPDLDPADVAFSLLTTRSSFERRAGVVAAGREELRSALAALAAGEEVAGLARGGAAVEQDPVFLFPGQGSQWLGMAVELAATSAPFDRYLSECDEALSPYLDWSVRDVLFGAEGAPSISRIEVVQPALFATMVSLARLWRRCGVRPAAVVGHSQGEIAAAHIAGGLSLEDAAMLAAVRSQIIAKLAGQGAMVSVALPAGELGARIERFSDQIEVAAENGPGSTILSVGAGALEELLGQCEEEGVRARQIPATIPSHSARVEPLRSELLEALATIVPRAGEVPFHSTVTGAQLDTAELGAEYWYRNLRQPVLFEQVTRGLLRQGRSIFLEVSPHPVFALAVGETADEEEPESGAKVLGTLRRDDGGAGRFALALAQAHAEGAKVDWPSFFEGSGAAAVKLPTYPFQRKRYWMDPAGGGPADLAAAGQASPDHPLLGATVALADGEGLLLTGRVSLRSHPWLGDHAVAGTVLLPGTAFVDMALRAGEEVGCDLLEELTLQAPLVLEAESAAQIQLSLAEPGENGRREIAIYSRPEAAEGEAAEWTCHAKGILSSEARASAEPLGAWPPEGVEPVEIEGLYDRLAGAGFDYGPAFQGTTAAWSDGEELFAEISLPDEQARAAPRFAIHPALLDAAAHAGIDLALASAGAREEGQAVLPFAWQGVRLAARGASSLRIRLRLGSGCMAVFDGAGAAVLSIASVAVRPIDPAQLQAAVRQRSLYRPQWSEVEAASANGSGPPSLAILGEAGIGEIEAECHSDLAALREAVAAGEPPEVVLADFRQDGESELPAAARAATEGALSLLQEWLAEESLAQSRLVLLTEGALAAVEGEDPNLASSPIGGLLRSAHSEHPGRFSLLDTDAAPASLAALATALAVEGEPQLALREGRLLAPRLFRVEADAEGSAARPIDPQSTVLITGGASGLGALFARHLASAHGARQLLLVSRRGPEAPAAAQLATELEELGATVTIAACDVGDREQLSALFDSIPPEHPLGAVIHSAAVLDDGVLESLDGERLQRVFGPKLDAAWHLHELTRELDLSQFLVFSSIGGLLGTPAQANYAAANAFLDALAAHRQAAGLPATALAWGGWSEGSLAMAELSDADHARLGRMGFTAMSSEQVVELFDLARGLAEPLLAPVEFNAAVLRAQAREGALAPILRGMVRVPARREGGSLSKRLAEAPEAERKKIVLELVRTHAATVLGHASGEDVEPDRAFQELGFDSLGAVELRNRLGAATGLRLPPTLVFDYPTATALAKYLLAQAEGEARRPAVARRATGAGDEPIAIVGMSCRFPGGASSPQRLWRLLAEGGDAIAGLPTDRGWDLERLYHPEPGHPGASYAREGGFVEDVAEFDHEFFRISPREALATDPQQRLLLESCWETLEDAGIDPGALRGSQTGVFAGVMYQDYGDAKFGATPGMTSSVVSGRVAYALGLEGPAMTVDTACSSSLVATHLAAQALRGGECDLALAGGVTVLSTPSALVFFGLQRGLATDGRCKAFAEAADGIGMAEGVGVLALERLSDAQRQGHPILATIRGSAVNQDGASNGLTAPNGPSQERVIRQALANARLTPSDIDAVEAHGTGTTLGDPIEAGALLATYGQDRERPLKLGSIKSNIGHTQAAAGVAGVIKTVMAMREGLLPKTLHVDQPSSKVDWEAGEIELLTEAEPWEPNGRPRRAGVSSFGFSGTNAHLIVEEAPAPATADASQEDGGEAPAAAPPGPLPFALSAKSEEALHEQASRLASHLEDNPELDPGDVAHSLATTRAAFAQRAAVVAEGREELLESLSALADGADVPAVVRGSADAEQDPVFVFPGQGAQFPGMGTELLETSPAFARHMDECEQALAPHVEWSLREVLRDEGGAWLERLDIVQPALFATMVSLARLWQERGVQPSVVIGHSQGEIAAAHVAGGLSLEDAALVVSARAKAMAKIAGQGAMLSVSLPQEQLSALLRPYGERISLAAINGPASLVLSGEPKALAELGAHCEREGIRAQSIAVDYAAHSAQIEDLEEELLEAFAPISPRSGEIPMHSTLSGEPIDLAELDAGYWYRNLRQTVRFEPALRSLLEAGQRAFVEVSPHPVLSFPLRETIDAAGQSAAVIDTLRRDDAGLGRFALSLAAAHVSGVEVDWNAFFAGAATKAVALPTYPFQRRRYWLTSSGGAGDVKEVGLADAEHPFLGAAVELAGGEGEGRLLTGRISLASHPWLEDHAIAGAVLLPSAAFVELALRAGEQAGCGLLEELAVEEQLILERQGAVQVQVSLGEPDRENRREVSIYSRPEGAADREPQGWTRHAQGTLSPQAPAPTESRGAWPPEGAEPLEIELLYDRLAGAGLEHGPAFQGLTAAWQEGETIYAEASLPEEQREQAGLFGIHPALLDSALHQVQASLADAGPALPVAWRGACLHAVGASSLRLRLEPSDDGWAVSGFDDSGAPVISIGAVIAREVALEQLETASRERSFYGVELAEVQPAAATDSELPSLLVLGDADFAGLEAERRPDLPSLLDGIAEGAPAPEVVIVDARRWSGDGEEALPEAAHRVAQCGLELIQQWLADDRLERTRLVFCVERALAGGSERLDLALAPLCGLLGSAHSEHPGRLALIDSDGTGASDAALPDALRLAAAEPQLALREGRLLAPRLFRVEADAEGSAARPIDPQSTVLITGGASGLGALFARHLASAHGARQLLLVSRRGPEAPAAAQLATELEELGATVTIAACDVGDREQLSALFDSIPPEHPLGAVIHSAAVLDDGVLESLDGERLQRVFGPKLDAAWHLHELTRELDLSQFVVFSSAAGLLGGAAQANYAAANAFLDALAAQRRGEGLPATALAWGLWAQQSSASAKQMDQAQVERMVEQIRARLGFTPMLPARGLELFDAALAMPEPLLAPVQFSVAALEAQAKDGALPAILRGIVRTPARRRRRDSSLAKRLAKLPEAEREATVLELAQGHVATVLGYASPGEVDPDRAFQELGMDSLGAVELGNRLGKATGLRLAPTLIFDYPSTRALAAYLASKAMEGGGARKVAVKAHSSDEPIAIVGMSCRFPGSANSIEDLWRLLAEGRDGVDEFPTDRGWDLDGLYHPDPDNPGTTYARAGGFVEDPAAFDPAFFGISPREAQGTDPQQRLLLEVSWEAFEQAGIDPATLRGSETGVFAGASPSDYGLAFRGDPDLGGYLGFGGSLPSVISGRVAYTLGLEGPAITIDTACSSSLVAAHLASQALRGGECSLALAGGVTILSTPSAFVGFSRQRGLAADGRSKAFSEAADGIGMGEGVGMLVLERLSDAEANGHPILATIKGSAINQDGASNGLTAPNGPSQERVIRQALANARLTPSDVDAVEAHGTGTTLGDPIEASALLATYGQDRERPLKLGSVKSNIGHTQAAAGVAGVIKTVLAMREGVLPKTLHVDAPSSKVDWQAGEIELLTEAEPWEAKGRPRRAGVSSFGASGTNAHLILEEAAAPDSPRNGVPSGADENGSARPSQAQALPGQIPLALSAKSEGSLRAQAGRLASHLQANPELEPVDVAYSLLTTRSTFKRRAVVLGSEREQLLEGLAAIERGEERLNTALGVARAEQRPAFLFSGQGAQFAGMAVELLDSSPGFARHMDECEQALSPFVDWSLAEVLRDERGAWLDRLDIVQPALFATMVSLARLWRDCGVEPAVLVGHSQGEIAAAHVAGGLSLDDAALVIALRAKAMAKIAGRGAMLSVSLPSEQLEARLEPYGERLSLAAINGPASMVVSGEPEALAELESACQRDGLRAQRIAVDYAAHSAQIEELEEELLEAFAPISPQSGDVPLHSTVTGEPIDCGELDAGYWYRNLRQTVLLEPVLRSLLEKGQSAFLEVSPHPVLGFGLQEAIDAAGVDAAVLGTLRRDDGGLERFALSLGQAHAAGVPVEWESFFEGTAARKTTLPTYQFQRKRYWLAPSAGSGDPSSIGQAAAEHPLLSAVVEDPDGEGVTLTGRLSLATHPWLADHAVAGAVFVPGTGFLELTMRAAAEVGCELLEELTLHSPLVLPEQGAMQVQVAVSGAGDEGRREVSIHARSEGGAEEGPGEWVRHGAGTLAPGPAEAPEPLGAWPPEGAEPIATELLYDRLAEFGLDYGPVFQGLERAWGRGGDVFAEVSLPSEQRQQAERFGIHPALLDSALHGALLGALGEGEPEQGLMLPFVWSDVSLHATGATELRVKLSDGADGGPTLVAFDASGAAVAQIGALRGRPLAAEQAGASGARREPLFSVQWEEVPAAEGGASADAPPPKVAVLGELELPGVERYEDVESLCEAIGSPEQAPEVVLCEVAVDRAGELAESARAATEGALAQVQAWLGEERLAAARLALLTRTAVSTADGELPDLAAGPVWGLVRSAQSEHPGRFALVDTDGTAASDAALPGALARTAEEPQLALREGVALAPRVAAARDRSDSLIAPAGTWRLDAAKRGTIESLELVPQPAATEPLGPTEVRIAMCAAGLNFRDILTALGIGTVADMVIGGEGAGIVVELGSRVSDLAVGDRVMGMIPAAFSPLAVSERALLVPVPGGWSFEQAAAAPIAFLTARYGLLDLAGLEEGEKVLIHAGAGGVGTAAIQIAQQLGAEVFATASPAKWEVLREAGLAADQIASSRDLDFAEKFLDLTGGEGMDVVLNSLAGEFVDASFRLLPRGGRFAEMGKADVRDAEAVAAEHPGISYRAFDLVEAGSERLGEMLAETVELFARGAFDHSAVSSWDMRAAPEAFRHLREGRNVGKVVLTVPRAIDPQRTVLLTGGTGMVGALVARHLVSEHGARQLLLVSRSGEEAPGAVELRSEIEAMGAEVTIAACDVADRGQLEELLSGIPAEHPLGAVIHAAGALDDGVVESLSAEQIGRVFAPKVDAAWNLHELTADLDLSAFVLFSSLAGTLGTPGQANYAAANVFLDALAARRSAEGRPATSMVWGFWETASGMTSHLDDADTSRMQRSGAAAFSNEEGLGLFDAAVAAGRHLVLTVPLGRANLGAGVSADDLPPIMRGLVRAPAKRRAASTVSLAAKLAGVAPTERAAQVLELVSEEAAAVLGQDSAAIGPGDSFKDLGFDSLAAVELRNRLASATLLRLPATLVFDYPTAGALADYLLAEAQVGSDASPAAAADDPFAAASAGDGGGSAATIKSLLEQARVKGNTTEFFRLLMATAPFRPSFEELPAPDRAPVPVRLSEGSSQHRLICLATAAHMSGTHEYTAFGESFQGEREVIAIPQPGFAPGELVPATLDLAVELQAEAVRRVAGEDPFVLVGYSTAGLYANAVAGRLEEMGTPPAAMVAIDSYRFDVQHQADLIEPLIGALLGDPEAEAISTTRLTAMAAHLMLLSSWSLADVGSPRLLAKATEPVPGIGADQEWRCTWGIEDEVEVPGNHFTVMQEHAGATAQAIDSWLSAIQIEPDDRQVARRS